MNDEASTAVWALSQSWRHVLFAHWPVETQLLRKHVPAPLELDVFENQAWVGFTSLLVCDLRAFAVVPIPVPSQFAEVNVRTYVRYRGRPGVLFLSLEAANPAAVAVGRAAYSLPYSLADAGLRAARGRVVFESSRRMSGKTAEFSAVYKAAGRPRRLSRGTLGRWLLERRRLFAVGSTGRVLSCEVEHRPWLAARAHAEVSAGPLASACGLKLPRIPPMTLYADRQDARVSQPIPL